VTGSHVSMRAKGSYGRFYSMVKDTRRSLLSRCSCPEFWEWLTLRGT
jgi:hypothetical protein